MKGFLATTILVTGAMLAGGCATKKYVRKTTAPIQAKVDQVGEQTTQNTSQIQDTRNEVKQVDDRAQSGISAAQERASTADQHAGEAMNKATAANQLASTADQKADQNTQALRSLVANIDDYKLQTSATVPFPFNRYNLTDEDKANLDKLADEVKNDRRYFIAVEGYTDSVGPRQYNEELSRRRAEAVENYLVAQHDIPLYRIHIIGLGEERPVDAAHTRAARAKNRRVEVKVFSADQALSSLGMNGSSTEASRGQENK